MKLIVDNNVTCIVPVHVGVPGDVSSPLRGVYDGVVNMRDIAYMIILFNTRPNSPNWNPNADVDNDGVCNMRDIAIAILNFNKHEQIQRTVFHFNSALQVMTMLFLAHVFMSVDARGFCRCPVCRKE